MELVINISEDLYNNIIKGKWEGNPLADYIENGTPLPKGHGELIDRNALIHEYEVSNIIHHYGTQIVKVAENAKVLVKADKGEE